MPDDITQLEAANLTELIGKFTQLQAYVNAELAECEAEIIRLRAKMREEKVTFFVTKPGLNNQEKWKRDAVLEAEEGVRKVQRGIEQHEADAKIIRCYVENYERYISALSRDLTRRKL